ncbi:hypothetical protein ACFPIJ_23530 [Dactylosporangium cerinum]|uniref:Uncharacterized protein n=1 Tax=Dactylosporangium cerinum TaxID=1434730 RepID=A0ABV9W063_9ACTN
MSNAVPPLLAALVDDAAVFPPGNMPLPDAVPAHLSHRHGPWAAMIGPLLIPADDLSEIATAVDIGIVGPPGAVEHALETIPGHLTVRQIESPVAKRGEDPAPGIDQLAGLLRKKSDEPWSWYFEVPLAWGLMRALDQLAQLRAEGLPAAAKFRTGGLAAELFPTPVELAAVICACRDRELPFKLTAGLHHAVRHTDPDTGLVHHGFLNVLAATLAAAGGAEPADLAGILAGTDAHPLTTTIRAALDEPRPLWVGFGSCSVDEPVTDLTNLGLLPREVRA